jgi:hypothetical protein
MKYKEVPVKKFLPVSEEILAGAWFLRLFALARYSGPSAWPSDSDLRSRLLNEAGAADHWTCAM